MSRKMKVVSVVIGVLVVALACGVYFGGENLMGLMRGVSRGPADTKTPVKTEAPRDTMKAYDTTKAKDERGVKESADVLKKFSSRLDAKDFKALAKNKDLLKSIDKRWEAVQNLAEKYFMKTKTLAVEGWQDIGINPDDYYDTDGKFMFVAYMEAVIDAYVSKPDNFPESYLWVFPFNYPVKEVDPTSLSQAKPFVAGNFVVCPMGPIADEGTYIKASAFDLDGGGGGKVEFEMYKAESQGLTALWDDPISTSIYSWHGDLDFTNPAIYIDEKNCALFHIKYVAAYNPWDSGNDPAWVQMRLDNVLSEVPAYYIGDGINLEGLIEEWAMLKGTLTVFDPKEAVVVYTGNDDAQSYQVGSTFVNIASFDLYTYPNSEAKINSIDLNFSSSYDQSFDAHVSLWKNNRGSYYNYSDYQEKGFDIVLHPGVNEIDIDESMSFGTDMNIQVSVDQAPSVPGQMQVTLEDVDSDGEAHEGFEYKDLYYDENGKLDNGDDIFDGKEFPAVEFIKLSDADPYLQIYYWPKKFAQKTYSKTDVSFDGENYNPSVFELNVSAAISGGDFTLAPSMRMSSLSVTVDGSFTSPISMKVLKTKSTPDDFEESFTDYNVLPGSVITLPQDDFVGDSWTSYYFYVDEFPADAYDETIFMRFKVPSFDAEYLADGYNVSAGDKVPLFVHNDDWEYVFDYPFPIVSGKSLFAPTLVYKTTDYNKAGSDFVVLDDLSPEVLSDELFVMNNVCFKAQGNAVISEFTFEHMAREESPFDDVILDFNGDNIYLKDAGWSLNTAKFKLTTPKVFENQEFCLNLMVSYPTEFLEDAWFNLTDIKAENTLEENIPVYNPYAPLGQSASLSSENPVYGTVYSFYD